MFDSGISAKALIAELQSEVDVALPITNSTYATWLNSLQWLLYSAIIKEQNHEGKETSYSNWANVSDNPIWLKLEKKGANVKAFFSSDKNSWTEIGSRDDCGFLSDSYKLAIASQGTNTGSITYSDVTVNDKEVKLTTYDLEIGIEYIIECNVKEQGNTVVNATMFSEIIRKLPDTEITISINENNLLEIECEGSLYKLATMNPEEFPELPKINIDNSIEIEQNLLKNMIRKTIFAVSNEENRPIFTGCLFEVENNKLNVVAVDGYRLALKTNVLNSPANNFHAVIPGKTLNEINKIILDSFDTSKIGISKNQALFNMENCKIVTRLLN